MKTSFLKATSITLVTRVINLCIGILVSILLARLLGPEQRGIYALALLIPSFAAMFTGVGLGPSTIYFLGKKKYPPQTIAGTNITISVYISITAVLLTVGFIILFKETFLLGVPVYAFVLVVCAIPFVKFTSILTTVVLGIHKYVAYNVINIVHVTTQAALFGLLLLVSAFNLSSVLIVYLIATVVVFTVAIIYLKKQLGTFTLKIDREYLKDAFSYGLKAYLGTIISFLHLRIDQLIINFFLNPVAVGFYAISAGLTERLWLLSESAGTILFPRISSESDETEKKRFTPLLCRNILLLTVVGAGTLFYLGRWLIELLYSTEYLDSIPAFKILLIGTIFVSGSKILANDISGRGKPLINSYINGVSLVVNILLNIILIPQYGIVGAAWATTISYSMVFLVRLIAYIKISGNTIFDTVIVKPSDATLYKDAIKALFQKMKAKNDAQP